MLGEGNMGIHRRESYIFRRICILTVASFILFFIFGFSTAAADETDAALLEEYAPIFYFENGETCFPINVSYHIENSYLYQFTGDEPILITQHPTEEVLKNYSTDPNLYLDNQMGTVNDDGIITDYHNKMEVLGYTVYARSYHSGEITVLQYWMFYAFNKGELNQHECDWEMVQIVLSNGTPTEGMYSQHHSGQKATWEQLEKEGNHIKVYVARGSHANYLRSYAGKLGVADDIVGANGKILRPDSYTLITLTSQNWLQFAGRWGEVDSYESILRGEAGPFGPMFRENGLMWQQPLQWGNSLIPLNEALLLLEWFLYHFLTIFILLTIFSLGILGYRIYKRHKKTTLGPRIFSCLYIDGFNLKTIGNLLFILGIIIGIFGLFHSWFGVFTTIDLGDFSTQGAVKIISIDGINGIQINTLDPSKGPVQLGSFSLPFSLLLGISIVFGILGTIGISKSKTLGKRYIFRGVKLLLPIIVLLIALIAIGFLPIQETSTTTTPPSSFEEVFNAISHAPFGGETTIHIEDSSVSGEIFFQWGVELGGKLLLLAGAILIISGILELLAKTSFYVSSRSQEKQNINPEINMNEETSLGKEEK